LIKFCLISFDFFKINDTSSIKSTSNEDTKDIFLIGKKDGQYMAILIFFNLIGKI
jgi:hypothetical protein